MIPPPYSMGFVDMIQSIISRANEILWLDALKRFFILVTTLALLGGCTEERCCYEKMDGTGYIACPDHAGTECEL